MNPPTDVSFLNNHLNLIIFPTEACDFRCSYCYEDHAKNNGMRPEVVEGIRKLMSFRAPQLEELRIEWFGGEPLLRYDIMLNLMQYAQMLGEKNNFRVKGMATTNGYRLTQDRISGLISAGVSSYQITLDGDRDNHDKLRVRTNGKGTFNKIWENLICARHSDLDFSIIIRIHVNGNNKESVRSLLKNISNEMGGDSRFEIFPRFLSRLGGPNDHTLPITSDMGGIREFIASLFSFLTFTFIFLNERRFSHRACQFFFVSCKNSPAPKCNFFII